MLVHKPQATPAQARKALDMLLAAQRPVIVAGGGVIGADACDLLVELAELLHVPVIPTLMGWGAIPDDHPLTAGMAGLPTAHRYGNATLLASDLVLGIGNRWANRHTGGLDTYRRGRRFVHIDIEPTQIGRVFPPDYGVTSDAHAARELLVAIARERAAAGELPDYRDWARECRERVRTMDRRSDHDTVSIKPQRVPGDRCRLRPQRAVRHEHRARAIGAAQFLRVNGPRRWINCGQAGPLGWTVPAALGAVVADPRTPIVAISGDYDFQFMLEELAVGAQFHLPNVHIVLNNSYLGLIRQAQRAYDMDYCVQLGFKNVNAPELDGYGVDHVAVACGLGCCALRVREPDEIAPALKEARELAAQNRVLAVVEVMLERITDLAMGSEIDAIVEHE